MLVLSRQKDESIVIGDDIEIVIVDVRGDKVRLGITAPKEIPVHRREIYDAIQREKAEAKAAEEKTAGEKDKPDKPVEKVPKGEAHSEVENQTAEPAVKKRSK
jgi:carbon storage regulator